MRFEAFGKLMRVFLGKVIIIREGLSALLGGEVDLASFWLLWNLMRETRLQVSCYFQF